MKILNLGCGAGKIEGCINVDIVERFNPDIVCDILTGLPFPDESIDKVYLFHVIEHIPKHYHPTVITNISKILTMGGILYVSYPEFVVCARNFIDNKYGKRDFWEATIYGRQLQPFDYHVSLMYTPSFTKLLISFGFEVDSKPESEDYNTICKCTKVGKPLTIESIYKKNWFGYATY